MSVTEKVKAALALKGKKNKDLAEVYGMSDQSIRNKLTRGSFSAEDLILAADLVGGRLLIEVDGTQIPFTLDDIRKPADKED